MRVVTKLTGLTADTIRAWERRYSAIEPVRTAGNTRLFTRDHIRRLLLLREAKEKGFGIGQTASLDDTALEELARPSTEVATGSGSADTGGVVADYVSALAAGDTELAWSVLRRAALWHAPESLVFEVMGPIVEELAARHRWGEFDAPLMRVANRQLDALSWMARAGLGQFSGPRWLVASVAAASGPSWIAPCALVIFLERLNVAELGPDASHDVLRAAVDDLEPTGLLVDTTGAADDEMSGLMGALMGAASKTRVIIFTPSASPTEPPPGLVVVTSLTELKRSLVEGSR